MVCLDVCFGFLYFKRFHAMVFSISFVAVVIYIQTCKYLYTPSYLLSFAPTVTGLKAANKTATFDNRNPIIPTTRSFVGNLDTGAASEIDHLAIKFVIYLFVRVCVTQYHNDEGTSERWQSYIPFGIFSKV